MKTKLLFVCTANINRSRAAEELVARSGKYEVRSAGFQFCNAGENRVTGQILDQELIYWADRIFVMDETNDHHLTKLKERFNVRDKEDRGNIVVLEIPDRFDRGDPVLSATLRGKLAANGIEI